MLSIAPQFQPLLKYWGHLKNFYSDTTNYGVDGKNLWGLENKKLFGRLMLHVMRVVQKVSHIMFAHKICLQV